MRNFKLLTMVLMLFVAVTGCKYEEGPFVSVIPRVERVTNTWIVSSATLNGAATDLSDVKSVTFYKEGGFQVILVAATIEFAYTGTWAFNADKSTILINSTDELTGLLTYNREWTILRLKEDALHVTWTEGNNNSDLYDVTFAPAQP